MQLVVAAFALSDVAARGEVRLSHVRAGLQRALEPHEDVVVHCTDGEFVAATVIDFEFDLEDTYYVLEIGVRLPPLQAAVLLGVESQDAADQRGPVAMQDILDLLDDLRRDGDLPV
ncbi:hypothetical protein [Nocardioides sp.]|uniref:hypothetical protein n=1 Tax=Nocardioides sp. TaxID=35761 RepID=UPI002B277E3B|nr:hypothetical protein [Nocardioides sp.]